MAVALLTRLGQMELRSVRRARHPSQAGYRYRPTTRVQRDAYAAGYKFIVIVSHLGIAVHLQRWFGLGPLWVLLKFCPGRSRADCPPQGGVPVPPDHHVERGTYTGARSGQSLP